MNKENSRWLLWGAVGLASAAAAAIPLLPVLRRRAMRVTTILKKDHRMVSAMIATIQAMPKVNRKAIKTLVEQLYSNVIVHETAEDEVVYSMIRNVGSEDARSAIDRAYREQETVKTMIEELRTLDPLGARFDQRLQEFKETITDHANLEESSVFTAIEDRVSEDRQTVMGERLHLRKKELHHQVAA